MRGACMSAGLVVAVATLLVSLADTLLQPDRYRPQIAAIVQRETGRALSLQGPMHVDWSLWPTLRISDVRLANLPGGSRPDMARAERIEAQVSLPALLLWRIEVTRLTLIGPNILFEQVGGVPNWVFHAAAPHRAGQPASLASGPRFPLEFRATHVRNGMITLRLPMRTNVIGIRSLDLAQRGADGALSLSAVLVYADNSPFALAASAVPTGQVTDPWITVVRMAAFDAAATATGRVGLAGAFDLQVEALVPRLEALDALLAELRLPALHGVRLSTRLANGPAPGDPPLIGRTRLLVASADLGDRLPGLRLDGLDVALPAAGGTVGFQAWGHLRAQALALAGGLAMPPQPGGRRDAAFHFLLRAGPDPVRPLGLLSADGRLGLDGFGFDGLEAGLRVQAPSLAALGPMLAAALPPLTDAVLAARLRVPADGVAVQLRDASLQSREGALTGGIAVGLRPPLSLTGRLHATRLDLDALLSPVTASPAPAAIPAAPRAAGPLIPDRPLPWRLLRGPMVDLTLQADAVRLRGQDWPDLEATLSLRSGRLLVSLPGGLLQGTIAADAGTDSGSDDVPVSLALRVPALPLTLLAGVSGLPGPASGSLRLSALLRAQGASAHALAASLGGRLTLAMGSGMLGDGAVRQLAGPALAALGTRLPTDGRIAIRCIGLDTVFAGGVARIPTLALDSDALTVRGDGEVDLGAEVARLRIQPLARLAGAAVAVPVLIDGPLVALRGRLQASALDKLALLIDAMFGGDHPKTCKGIDLL